MPCPTPEQAAAWLSRQVLTDDQRRQIEDHLDRCLPCQTRMREMRQADRLLVSEAMWRSVTPPQAASSSQRTSSQHLTGGDLLSALNHAGGGAHLEECESCRKEAQIILASVREFDAGKRKAIRPSLQSRLLAIHRPDLAELVDTNAASPPPSTESLSESQNPWMRPLTAPTPEPAPLRFEVEVPESADARRQRTSSRRGRTARVRRPRRDAISALPMPAVLSGLAAAAALLIAAVLFSGGSPNQPGRETALLPDRKPRGPLVSDRPGEAPKPQPGPQVTPEVAPEDDPAEPVLDPTRDILPPDRPRIVTPTPGEVAPLEPKRVDPSETRPGDGPALGPKDPDAPVAQPEGGLAKGPSPEEAFAKREISLDGSSLALSTDRVVGRLAVKRRGDAEWTNVRRGGAPMQLEPGDVLASRGGPVFLTLGDEEGLDLCLDDHTEVRVEGAKDGPVLGLGKGRIHTDYDRRFQSQAFVVRTPHLDFSTTGSTQAVEVGKGRTVTDLYQGQIFCSTIDGGGAVLEAGFAYSATAGAEPERVGKARPSSWSQRVRPRIELLYRADFESGQVHGFQGDLTARPDSDGAALKLRGSDESEYFGQLGLLRKGGFRAFRATENLFIRLSFRLSEEGPVLLQLNNVTQKKWFRKSLGVHAANTWKRVTINVMDDATTYFNPGKFPVERLDLFDELRVYAAAPGSTAETLIDDVEIFRKVYR